MRKVTKPMKTARCYKGWKEKKGECVSKRERERSVCVCVRRVPEERL